MNSQHKAEQHAALSRSRPDSPAPDRECAHSWAIIDRWNYGGLANPDVHVLLQCAMCGRQLFTRVSGDRDLQRYVPNCRVWEFVGRDAKGRTWWSVDTEEDMAQIDIPGVEVVATGRGVDIVFRVVNRRALIRWGVARLWPALSWGDRVRALWLLLRECARPQPRGDGVRGG